MVALTTCVQCWFCAYVVRSSAALLCFSSHSHRISYLALTSFSMFPWLLNITPKCYISSTYSVFTNHHFHFSISFLSLCHLSLVLIQFLPSSKHVTHCTMYVLHNTCYVIHIAVTSYHSVATIVSTTFVECHHWNMVFGVPPRQSAVDGTLSMECHSREAHLWQASLLIPTIPTAHLNFLKLHQTLLWQQKHRISHWSIVLHTQIHTQTCGMYSVSPVFFTLFPVIFTSLTPRTSILYLFNINQHLLFSLTALTFQHPALLHS